MLDQELQSQSGPNQGTAAETYDLVVIGAGIAGLNALSAATEYLPQGARVLLLDQKTAAGGMWNTAYDYVRLHQPHPMFTVGNMKWGWNKPRHYLASRDEVQAHLSKSLGPIGEKVSLSANFEHTMSRCEEIETSSGPMAEIEFHPNGAPNDKRTIRAKRAIYASGINYLPATPLKLTSESVISIIPQDLRETLAAHPAAPVVVVGGGKTGMDTVLATLADDPARKVSLLAGRGTNFVNRTKHLPNGLKRWTSGELVSRLFRELALEFDGDNEDHVLSYFRQHHSTEPASNNAVFLYGLQSEDEQAKVKSGLTELHVDYLQDVVDTPDGTQMLLRSGKTNGIAPGTIIVNCTGSFFRTKALAEPVPILSPKGCILSINARDAFHFLTSVTGFFATHLLYRDQLKGQGFYSIDLEALFRSDRNAWVGGSAAQAYMNQVIAVQTLPLMLLDRCGLDLDRWYPLPRRMAGLIRMKSSADRDIAHCRKVLDRVAERFDIHAAPLN